MYPITWPDLKNAGDAYLHSLDYEFAMLGDYLAKYVEAGSLIIIIGDHQPNLHITGLQETYAVRLFSGYRSPRWVTSLKNVTVQIDNWSGTRYNEKKEGNQYVLYCNGFIF